MYHNINEVYREMKSVASNNFGDYATKTEARQNVKLAIKQMITEFKSVLEENIQGVVKEMMEGKL
ncbi:MAG: hypothetical protein WC616_01545 [Candidatus Omnitrophota bacterium]